MKSGMPKVLAEEMMDESILIFSMMKFAGAAMFAAIPPTLAAQ